MVELRELNIKMGRKEYEMFQEIPAKENGSTNLCHGLPFAVFQNYIESQLARKYQKISEYDTPTNIYVMYSNNQPVGVLGIRTKINKQWREWCGNVFYVIRPKERQKGYGTQILGLAVKECKKLGLKQIFVCSSEGNIASQKVIKNNDGILLGVDGSEYYKIEII